MTFPAIEIQLDREYFMMRRQMILMELAYIEKRLGISPRVDELRKEAKERGREEMESQPEKNRV